MSQSNAKFYSKIKNCFSNIIKFLDIHYLKEDKIIKQIIFIIYKLQKYDLYFMYIRGWIENFAA